MMMLTMMLMVMMMLVISDCVSFSTFEGDWSDGQEPETDGNSAPEHQVTVNMTPWKISSRHIRKIMMCVFELAISLMFFHQVLGELKACKILGGNFVGKNQNVVKL